ALDDPTIAVLLRARSGGGLARHHVLLPGPVEPADPSIALGGGRLDAGRRQHDLARRPARGRRPRFPDPLPIELEDLVEVARGCGAFYDQAGVAVEHRSGRRPVVAADQNRLRVDDDALGVAVRLDANAIHVEPVFLNTFERVGNIADPAEDDAHIEAFP